MFKLLLRLSTLSMGITCVLSTTSSSASQLASLNERMSQMLSALYASPLLSKPSATSTSSDEEISTTTSPETSYILSSVPPQVVYVSPSPYLEAGAQPNDYGYPKETHPVARSAWPYPYELAYPAQYSQPGYPSPLPTRSPYPEVPRLAYPQMSGPAPLPSQFSSPVPCPSPLSYSPVQYPGSLASPYPSAPYQSVAPPFSPAVYSQTPQPSLPYSSASPFSYPSYSLQAPYPLGYSAMPAPGFPSPNIPPGCPAPTLPSVGYPSPSLPSYPSPPMPSPQYPTLPSPFSSAYPSGLPSLYPPGTFNAQAYPSPMFASPPYPARPKYSEVLHHPFDLGA